MRGAVVFAAFTLFSGNSFAQGLGAGGGVLGPTEDSDPVVRGAYLIRAGGCVTCHTQEKGGEPLAGGRALKTPFGTYYSPNITPDEDTGIGTWSDDDFIAALREGVSPDGSHYFPVFPYPTYTKMTERDALAIKRYLFSLSPISRRNREHDVSGPFGWRWTVAFWKLLFFDQGPGQPDPNKTPAWNRGNYLVNALTHCGECHTPRNAMGALDRDMHLAGTADGPDGELVPNITPHEKTGIGEWSEGDIVVLLRDGLKPSYDDVQGSMGEAIEDGLSSLTEDDLKAIAVYLKSIPAIENRVEKSK